MKDFSEWVRERDPEVYNELFSNLKKGINNLVSKAAVGVKRAGERTEKLLGGDPHARQRGNRQKNKEGAEFSAILKDL